MQTSGFFNALNNEGVYDRTYNANDYCDNLAVVISNGVLRSANDDLKVTASGMVATVGVGRGWIKGHWYNNDTPYSFPAVSAPISGQRYDRVVLRFNNELTTRAVYLAYVQGTASSTPVKPSPMRTDTIYDLVLADILIDTNATSVTVTDTRADNDLCGWVFSTSGDTSFFTSLDNSFNNWFEGVKDDLATVTIFKSYLWRSVLASATKTVQFNIPQYDGTGVNVLEVYVNGMQRSTPAHYSVSGNVITFTGMLTAGTEVVAKVWQSIDGTGIDTIVDNVTDLQNRVAQIEGVAEFTYDCTGVNDNVSISQIAQAIYSGSYVAANVTAAAAAFLDGLGGNTYLAALPSDAHITISVVGKLGVTAPYSGGGTSANRYKWFALGVDAAGNTADGGGKLITFDFANCERILVYPTTNTDNIIFYGTDMDIRNVDIYARCTNAGCSVEMLAGRYNYGRMNFENCRFRVVTTGRAVISENGTFTNCFVYCSSSDNHALVFNPTNDSLIRVIGGTYYAYTASANSGVISAIFYTYSTDPNAVAMAYNINCPTKAVTSFYQKYLSVAYGGKIYINGVVTPLANLGNNTEVVGLVNKSKAV